MTTETLAIADLEAMIARGLEHAGTSTANAASVARALTQAEIDGQKGHGLSRLPIYASHVRAGKVDGHAAPIVARTRPGVMMIDAASGFAFPALDRAVDELPALARAQGIAAAGIVRSHHAGALGLVVERLANAGLVALAFANTPHAIAPWGGTRAVFGTNPIAFAAPRGPGAPGPVVVDLALAQVARGKILTAAQQSKPIPPDWATDEHGQPTTDAKAALKGMLQPIGGAKGAALAFMVETLAAALVGARLGFEAASFLDTTGGPPGTGQLVLAVDPGALAGSAAFADRLAALAHMIEGEAGGRLPGSRRFALRAKAARDGVTVEHALANAARALGQS